MSGSKGKVDGKWVEDKDEAAERTREAVLIAMRSGNYKDNILSMSDSSTGESSRSAVYSVGERSSSSEVTTPPSTAKDSPQARTFFGFDDEDEFMSEDESSEEEDEDERMVKGEALESSGKGKQKA